MSVAIMPETALDPLRLTLQPKATTMRRHHLPTFVLVTAAATVPTCPKEPAMIRSSRLAFVSAILSTFGALFACSGTPSQPAVDPKAPITVNEALALEGDIGPSGGVLTGAPRSAFDGVVLEVPSGALASETHLKIVQTLDASPLPDNARGVGPQFAMEGNVRFEKAVRLTLPVSAEYRELSADGLKVWMRDSEGDGWNLLEPSATTSGSVTVDTSTLLTAAAGRKVFATPIPCAVLGNCAPVVACTVPGGLCIDSTATTISSLFAPRAVLDGTPGSESIVFFAPQQGPVATAVPATVGKLRLPTKQLEFSTKTLPNLTSLFETGIFNNFSASGAKVDLVSGDITNAVLGRFIFPTAGSASRPAIAAPAQQLSASKSLAALALGDGRTVTFLEPSGSGFRSPSFVLRTAAGQVSGVVGLAGGARTLVMVAPDPSRGDAFWMFGASADGFPIIERFDTAGNILTSPTLPNDLKNRLMSGGGGGGGSDGFTFADTTGIAATKDGLFVGFTGTATPPADSPTILHIGLDGSFDSRARLGAAPGTTLFARGLTADNEGNLWLLNRGSNAGTGVLTFLGPGGTSTPTTVPLDPSFLLNDIFPSAERGVWVQGIPITGSPRNLTLLKVRPSGG